MEELLTFYLGVTRTLWIEWGLPQDATRGHVDEWPASPPRLDLPDLDRRHPRPPLDRSAAPGGATRRHRRPGPDPPGGEVAPAPAHFHATNDEVRGIGPPRPAAEEAPVCPGSPPRTPVLSPPTTSGPHCSTQSATTGVARLAQFLHAARGYQGSMDASSSSASATSTAPASGAETTLPVRTKPPTVNTARRRLGSQLTAGSGGSDPGRGRAQLTDRYNWGTSAHATGHRASSASAPAQEMVTFDRRSGRRQRPPDRYRGGGAAGPRGVRAPAADPVRGSVDVVGVRGHRVEHGLRPSSAREQTPGSEPASRHRRTSRPEEHHRYPSAPASHPRLAVGSTAK